MIHIFKLKNIEDEKERDAVVNLILQKEHYYKTLFKNSKNLPKITIKFEGTKPLTIRIIFDPITDRRVIIDVDGYTSADALTKYAFKKLRRVAKNYFVKTKKRYKQTN